MYACNENYELEDPSVDTLTCGATGTWDDQRPACGKWLQSDVGCSSITQLNKAGLKHLAIFIKENRHLRLLRASYILRSGNDYQRLVWERVCVCLAVEAFPLPRLTLHSQ